MEQQLLVGKRVTLVPHRWWHAGAGAAGTCGLLYGRTEKTAGLCG